MSSEGFLAPKPGIEQLVRPLIVRQLKSGQKAGLDHLVGALVWPLLHQVTHPPHGLVGEGGHHVAVLLDLAGHPLELEKALGLREPHGRRLCPESGQAHLAAGVVARRRSLDVVFPRHGS